MRTIIIVDHGVDPKPVVPSWLFDWFARTLLLLSVLF